MIFFTNSRKYFSFNNRLKKKKKGRRYLPEGKLECETKPSGEKKREQFSLFFLTMIAISTALIHQVCSPSVARALRPRCVAAVPSRNLSTSISPSARPSPEAPKVLIGLSDQELQQLALDFGQVTNNNHFLVLLKFFGLLVFDGGSWLRIVKLSVEMD